MVLQGIQAINGENPYIFVIFQGRSGPPVPPSGSAHEFWLFTYQNEIPDIAKRHIVKACHIHRRSSLFKECHLSEDTVFRIKVDTLCVHSVHLIYKIYYHVRIQKGVFRQGNRVLIQSLDCFLKKIIQYNTNLFISLRSYKHDMQGGI